MKKLKNITILLCFLSLLAFISCSAEDKTGSGGTRTLSYYAGDWWGNLDGSGEEGGHMLTVNVDDSVILKNVGSGSGSDLPIPSTDITKNSDASYTLNFVMTGASGNVKLDFSSDTTGTLTLTQGEAFMTVDITKR